MSKCLRCGYSMTWESERRQYGRVIRDHGLTAEDAKAFMPRCQVCVTSLLGRKRARHSTTSAPSDGQLVDL